MTNIQGIFAFLVIPVGLAAVNQFCWMQIAADVDSKVYEKYHWGRRLPFPPNAQQLLREHHTNFPKSKLGFLAVCTTVISIVAILALLTAVFWLIIHKEAFPSHQLR